MKKIVIILSLLSVAVFGGFDFGACSGSGTFEQEVVYYNHDFENTALVGTIPQGIEGLSITLVSDKDVDIRLYGQDDDKIVHWPYGILYNSDKETELYKSVPITYSGYNGIEGAKGHEYIEVNGTTPSDMTMKAFGYQAGYATVNYSWTGKEGCTPVSSGEGNFTQDIVQAHTSLVGTIPPNVNDVRINLTSENDLDIQLYGQEGTAIVSWNPTGLLSGAGQESITYHGMHIEWSGYNGVDGKKGNEYIKITGITSEMLVMKVYGYETGTAEVNYSWGTNTTQASMGSLGLDIPDTIYPTQGNGGYDVAHYDIALAWDSESGAIEANTTIQAKSTQNLTGFYLDFHALSIESIRVNDINVTYEREEDNLKIILPQSMILAKNVLFSCVVRYHGVPQVVPNLGGGWTNTDEGNVVVASEPIGAMNWFPCNNHPRDKATYTFEITAPKPYIVAANGNKTQVIETETSRTYTFVEDNPMMTYVAMVAIADFDVQESIGELTTLPITNYIEMYYLDQDYSTLLLQDEVIAYESDILGAYPFDEAGGIVMRAPYSFSLETQSVILYLNRFIPLVHETAHQWFGDSLSIYDWKDIWLNEGFATYMDQVLWYEHTHEGTLSSIRNLAASSEGKYAPGNVTKPEDVFNYTIVYRRGARVLVALRERVGEEIFLDIFRTYVSRYKDKNVSTETFIALCEEISEEDLSAFFLEWLYGGEKLTP